MLDLILDIVFLLSLVALLLKVYRLKKEVKVLKQVRFDPTNHLHSSIVKELYEKGQVEVLAAIYTELYELKKQLMSKGVIDPELGYLLGEIYETFEEFDKKAKIDPNKR